MFRCYRRADADYRVVIDRYYNSLQATGQPFPGIGQGWNFAVGPGTRIVQAADQSVELNDPTGARLRFVRDAEGNYTGPAGIGVNLIQVGTGWEYRRTNDFDVERVYVFGADGALSAVRDDLGRVFTPAYTSAGGRTVLSSFGDQSGRRANFSFNGDGLVRLIDSPSSKHHTYDHQSGKLTSYSESTSGAQITYSYDLLGRINGIQRADGSSTTVTSDSSGRVLTLQQQKLGTTTSAWSFDYSTPGQTTVTGPDGTDIYSYNADGVVTSDGGPADTDAPAAPTEFQVDDVDAATGKAEVSWLPGNDPDLPDGEDGSGADRAQYRVLRNGTWSGWSTSDEDIASISNVTPGESVTVSARSIDVAGNAGPAASATLALVAPDGSADRDDEVEGNGTSDLRVTVRRRIGDDYEPRSGTYVEAKSATRTITARADDDGIARFPKIENGTYDVRPITESSTREVTITSNDDQSLTYTLEPRARAAQNGSGDPVVDLLGELRVWCVTGNYRDVETPGTPGLIACRRWEADADLAQYLANRLFTGGSFSDGTKANAFQHMAWNALMIGSIYQTRLIADDDSKFISVLKFSNEIFEYDGIRTTNVQDGRASTMDRHNNRLGWNYMIRRTPQVIDKKIPDFGICKRIRRLVGSVQKARYITGSKRLVAGTNRFRPIRRFKRAALGEGEIVQLRPQTPTFDPCGPLKPGRG